MNKRNRESISEASRFQMKDPRLFILGVFLLSLFCVLIVRMYRLQIIEGEKYQNDFMKTIQKTQRIVGNRGRIYDRNGTLLAEDQLSYDLVVEDSGNYTTMHERQGTLNGVAYQLQEHVGDINKMNMIIPIGVGPDGAYLFTESGFRLQRFKADLFGRAAIEDLTEEESNLTAEEVIDYMCSETMFLLGEDNAQYYDLKELEQYGLPVSLRHEELLQIVNVRYGMYLNSYRKYLPFLVASDISEEAMAAVLENGSNLTGTDVQEGSIRVYYGDESLSGILGYTGFISSEELEQYGDNGSYTSQSVVGKSGIEKSMEEWLRGRDGQEQFWTDVVGRRKTEPELISPSEVGKDVYLTIDKNLQEAVYQMLEQQIAGILLANMVNVDKKDMPPSYEASQIRIPIDDVFAALFQNHVINIGAFEREEASELEKQVLSMYDGSKKEMLTRIESSFGLVGDKDSLADDDFMKYHDYILSKLKEQGGLSKKSGSWNRENQSLRDYLKTEITKGTLDLEILKIDRGYYSIDELELLLEKKILEGLQNDDTFTMLIYENMVRNHVISGTEVIRLLYEQNQLSKDDPDYPGLLNGSMTAWEFIRLKIRNLEITPAQLALEPCSGSVVVTNPQNGQVLACVSYPGYDSNRMANQKDRGYYQTLLADRSLPMFNRATGQLTAPGSTFKPITMIAGLNEHVIDGQTAMLCDGVFDKVSPSLRCWNRAGHGMVGSSEAALSNSCNDYLCDIAYRLGSRENGVFQEEAGLEALRHYSALFDLDKPTGIEIGEAAPHVTDQYAIPSAIGQGTHNYTTTQIARYAGTLANRGTSYQLSLIDRITDWEGTAVKEYTPVVQGNVELPDFIWDNVALGMKTLVETNKTLKSLEIQSAGKTGTAEESKKHPNHGWFIGYAPSDNPQIGITIRVGNGYSSGNVVGIGKNIFNYYFGLEEKEGILTGKAAEVSNNVRTD